MRENIHKVKTNPANKQRIKSIKLDEGGSAPNVHNYLHVQEYRNMEFEPLGTITKELIIHTCRGCMGNGLGLWNK